MKVSKGRGRTWSYESVWFLFRGFTLKTKRLFCLCFRFVASANNEVLNSIITDSLTELFNPDQIITFCGSKEATWCCFGVSWTRELMLCFLSQEENVGDTVDHETRRKHFFQIEKSLVVSVINQFERFLNYNNSYHK